MSPSMKNPTKAEGLSDHSPKNLFYLRSYPLLDQALTNRQKKYMYIQVTEEKKKRIATGNRNIDNQTFEEIGSSKKSGLYNKEIKTVTSLKDDQLKVKCNPFPISHERRTA